ncbi:MAG: hypothetical protein ACK44D_00105 [Bacteroidia bacterium]
MYKGEQTGGQDFYKLLLDSEEFTSEIGKLALASGMLEAEISMYLKRKGIKIDSDKVTLGRLITLAKKNDVFEKNLLIVLSEIKTQRNEFMHRLYSLFIGLLDEELFPIKNLLDSDVKTYIDYAWQVRSNIQGVAETISKK